MLKSPNEMRESLENAHILHLTATDGTPQWIHKEEVIKFFISFLATRDAELVKALEGMHKHCAKCDNGHQFIGMSADSPDGPAEPIWDGCQECVDENGQYIADRAFVDFNSTIDEIINKVSNTEKI